MRQRVLSCAVILLYLTIIGLVGCGGDSEEDESENLGSTGISYLIPGDGDSNFPTTSAILIAFDGDVVAPSAEGPKACDPMLQMYRKMFAYIKIELAGAVLVKAYEKGEIAKDKAELKKAFEFGASL